MVVPGDRCDAASPQGFHIFNLTNTRNGALVKWRKWGRLGAGPLNPKNLLFSPISLETTPSIVPLFQKTKPPYLACSRLDFLFPPPLAPFLGFFRIVPRCFGKEVPRPLDFPLDGSEKMRTLSPMKKKSSFPFWYWADGGAMENVKTQQSPRFCISPIPG